MLSSIAHFRFISNVKIEYVNGIQDYQINCKLAVGLSNKKVSTFFRTIQNELRKQQLHNKLLEEVIRIGGIQTGIDWKKKFGTRQS